MLSESDQARYAIGRLSDQGVPGWLGGAYPGTWTGSPEFARKFSHPADAAAYLESHPIDGAVVWDLRDNEPVEAM